MASTSAYSPVRTAHRRRDQGWRYFALRINGDGTQTPLSWDVPLTGTTFTDVLSGPNTLSASLEPEIKRMKGDDGRPIFRPWSTAIFAELDGTIHGGGILLPSSFNGPTWNIECTGFTSVLAEQPYTDSWFGVEIDPLDVVRQAWDHWQSKPGGNLPMQVANTKTGLKIGVKLKQGEFDTENGPLAYESGPVKLTWYETEDIGGFIDQLATDTPFDYHEYHQWEGEVVGHHLEFGYPKLGKRRPDLTFILGENVDPLPEVSEDEDQWATEVLALGAGEGAAMKHALAGRKNTGGLRRVALVSDKRANDQKKVSRLAQRHLSRYHGLDEVSEITVRQHPYAELGSWSVGDEIRVQGEAGWKTIDQWQRVLSYTMSPDDSDTAVLTLLRSGKEPE